MKTTARSIHSFTAATSDVLDCDRCPLPVWVKLKASPTAFSFDEALLLCEDLEGRWSAWVPDFGEITLTPEQFVRAID